MFVLNPWWKSNKKNISHLSSDQNFIIAGYHKYANINIWDVLFWLCSEYSTANNNNATGIVASNFVSLKYTATLLLKTVQCIDSQYAYPRYAHTIA